MAYPVKAVSIPSSLGGVTNGKLPASLLVRPGFPGRPAGTLHRLAANAWLALAAEVAARFGETLTVTSTADAYRTYAQQEATFRNRYTTQVLAGRPSKIWNGQRWYQKPGTAMAAVPGTSNHGWGLAIDTCLWRNNQAIGITANMAMFNWMLLNAFRFGLSWEAQSEPWHLRYYAGDNVPPAVSGGGTPLPGPDPGPTPPNPTYPVPPGSFTVPTLTSLRQGAPNNPAHVQVMQSQLNRWVGYPVRSGGPAYNGPTLSEDGGFGSQTDAALRAFQSAAGTTVDGVCGPKTWELLYSDC